MELFDPKFVHFMWDDELEGKKGFIAKSVKVLRRIVNADYCEELIRNPHDEEYPFLATDDCKYHFAYYDPNYSIKKAWKAGKKIQFCHRGDHDHWYDDSNPSWEPDCEYRVKPEEKWIVYLNRVTKLDSRGCYLTACREDKWETVQEEYEAKTKLFVGTDKEVQKWYKARQKFAEVIKNWEDGRPIQVRLNSNKWSDCVVPPIWSCDCEYRIKPECPCADGIDSKSCVGCEYRVKPEEKQYRPYISSAEMIADFKDRFNVKCPSYAEPLIWVEFKQQDCRFLITGIFSHSVKINGTLCMLENLFNCYTYRDGSPVGMEVKE